MSGKNENKHLVSEMAALGRMLGVSRRDKIRDVEIRERLGVNETLVQRVYQRQHTWLDYVWRMNNERIVKFALDSKVESKRRVGKPKCHGWRWH